MGLGPKNGKQIPEDMETGELTEYAIWIKDLKKYPCPTKNYRKLILLDRKPINPAII